MINDVHHNELTFQSTKGKEKSILLPCPIISVDIRKGKKARMIHVTGLSYLWDIGASDSMIKKLFVRKFREDFRKNRQQYDTAGSIYLSSYDVKINFKMIEFFVWKEGHAAHDLFVGLWCLLFSILLVLQCRLLL